MRRLLVMKKPVIVGLGLPAVVSGSLPGQSTSAVTSTVSSLPQITWNTPIGTRQMLVLVIKQAGRILKKGGPSPCLRTIGEAVSKKAAALLEGA